MPPACCGTPPPRALADKARRGWRRLHASPALECSRHGRASLSRHPGTGASAHSITQFAARLAILADRTSLAHYQCYCRSTAAAPVPGGVSHILLVSHLCVRIFGSCPDSSASRNCSYDKVPLVRVEFIMVRYHERLQAYAWAFRPAPGARRSVGRRRPLQPDIF